MFLYHILFICLFHHKTFIQSVKNFLDESSELWMCQLKQNLNFFLISVLQCQLLNVITDSVIIRLMCSNCPRLSRSQITNKQALCISRQLLIVIIRFMSQSDHIKRLPVYHHLIYNKVQRV